mmetsp:Transcript_27728/g.63755  ORF Transcript_27728/g.63755 Transcript_27728/m.63755 type:complete len:222 (-) Transcript_27728:1255-1920(-)
MAAGAVAGDSTSQVLAQQNEPPVAQLYQLRSENRQLELENRQLKAQNSQLEAQVASLNDEVAKQRLLGIPNTLAALPPASSPSSRSSRPPSYAGSTVRTATTYGPTEGAPRSQDTVSQPSLLQPESLDADPGLLAKMLAGLAGLEVTNAKNQLQEWCMSPSRRHPLPDYGECRPAPSGAGWESTVKIFDLQGQLILQESATAATKREAEMAAAHSALSSIH